MMTLTKGMIRKLRFPGRMDIGGELEAQLLQQFGSEPCPYEYTEQDLHENVRKFIMHYHQDKAENREPF